MRRVTGACALLAMGPVAASCDGGAARDERTAGDGGSVYVAVAVSDEVRRYDAGSGALLNRIPLDPRPSESDEPHGLAISPDGATWYATLSHGNPSLSKFERPGDRRSGRVSLDAAGAARVELDPTGGTAFIADYDRSRPGNDGEVVAVRLHDLRIAGRGRVCPGPHHALPNPATGQVAVACSLGDEVVVLSNPDLTVLRRFDVDPEPGPPGAPRFKPLNLAWSPDGRRLYVALHLADRVRAYDTDGTLLGEARTGSRPAQIVLSPDGRTLVSANRGDGTITVVDTGSMAVRARLELGAEHPHGIAMGGEGRRVYVSCEGTSAEPGRLVAVDLDGDGPSVAWSVAAGTLPLGVMWAPPGPES